MRKPFYKKSHDAWYCHSEQGVVRLGKTEAEAFDKWNELRQGKPLGLSLKKLAAWYLEWVERNRAKETYGNYKRHLDKWVKRDGDECVADIKPHHLDTLCKNDFSHCGETTHWQVYKVAIAMMNWAVDKGHIESHSLGKIKDKPQCGVREHWIKQEQFDKIIATASDSELRDLLTVLWETGARPFEITQVEARHLDVEGRCLRFSRLKGDKVKAKRKKKDAARIVQLTDKALAILARLAKHYPEGKLFRNTYGSPWTANLISARLRYIQKKCGVKASAYTFRHSFCTRAILSGVDLLSLKELMGHQDLAMISQVYAHLKTESGHLQSALGKIAG